MGAEYTLTEDGVRRGFYQMPNVVEALGLSAGAYRVYGHIKRVTGEGGVCYQSLETMGAACGMAKGTVAKAKTELERRGLLVVERVREGTRERHIVRVTDIWALNEAFVAGAVDAATVSKIDTVRGFEVPTVSKIEPVPYQKLNRKNTPSKNKDSSFPNGKEDAEGKNGKNGNGSAKGKGAFPKEVLAAMSAALAEVTRMDFGLNAARITVEAKALLAAGYSPEGVMGAYGAGGRYWKEHWKGQRGEAPTLGLIRQSVGQLVVKSNGAGAPVGAVVTGDGGLYA